MKMPSADILLKLWEQGKALSSLKRVLLLMKWLFPEASPETWPIGKRDANLFRLRQLLFGDTLPCYAKCPNCGEPLEFDLSVEALISTETQTSDLLSLTVDQETITFRLPTTQDLIDSTDVSGLLSRCMVSNCTLTPTVQTQMMAQMAQADPLADLQIKMTCPVCDHAWSTPFDIVSYFWVELERWAHQTLEAVHILAKTYGWSETSILNLSKWRRDYYLRMING